MLGVPEEPEEPYQEYFAEDFDSEEEFFDFLNDKELDKNLSNYDY